jgi:hypothetical protein
MRNKIWGIIKDKIHVDGTFNPLGLTYFKTSNSEQVDELTDAILQAIRDEVGYHKSPDNYEFLENLHAQCEHKLANHIQSTCIHCNVAWLIERCRVLERTLDQIKEALNK